MQKLHKHYIALALIALAGFCFALVSSYPGFLNLDSINQLQQAQGKAPLTDWHPPAMALLWRLLIFLTGSVSSLLVLQLLAFWLAFGAIAITIRKQTGSLKLALLPFVIAILPSSLIISGFYLKDVLMASLLCLVAALLYIGSYTKKKTRLSLLIFVTATILIIYSGNLRYNALPALIPLAYAASYNFFSNNRKTLLACVLIMVTIQISIMTIGSVFNIEKSRGQVALMVDDLKSLLTEEEIMASTMATETKTYLIDIKRDCARRGVLSHAFLECSNMNGGGFRNISTKDHRNIEDTWINSILDKPWDYIKFRLSVFWRFMIFTRPNSPSVDEEVLRQILIRTKDRDMGYMYITPEVVQQLPDKIGADILRDYSNYSVKDTLFIYRPYFWILTSIILLIYHRYKLSRLTHTYSALAVLISGIIYILTYIPVVSDYAFRFIYWTVLSIGIAFSIFLAEYYKSKNNLRLVS